MHVVPFIESLTNQITRQNNTLNIESINADLRYYNLNYLI